jgi:hypothetical protein
MIRNELKCFSTYFHGNSTEVGEHLSSCTEGEARPTPEIIEVLTADFKSEGWGSDASMPNMPEGCEFEQY